MLFGVEIVRFPGASPLPLSRCYAAAVSTRRDRVAAQVIWFSYLPARALRKFSATGFWG